jgi:xyloglucan-specific exo-beta-1,4-glucanase
MFFSKNQGTTVTDITSGLPDRYPRRIAVNPSNSKEVYIVFSGFGSGHVFKSINAGGTWTDISTTLPDMPFETVTVDPMFPTHLFAGCDYGVFYSTDDGNTWTAYDQGFPDATMVFDLLVSPSDHYLYGFTFGRGQWKRDLSDITTGTNDVKVSVTNGKIYPNPATTDLHINLSNYNSGNNFQLSVYTVQGKEVYNTNFQSYAYTIPVSNLASGMYIISVRNNGEVVFTDKFLKN